MAGRKKADHWASFCIPDRTPQPDADDAIDAATKPASETPIADTPEPDPTTELIPWFPRGSFTPLSKCPHDGPIRQGSSFVCMVCYASGKDGTKALPKDVQPLPLDLEPEPVEVKPAPVEAKPNENRKQRRERERAEALAREEHGVREAERRAG